MFFLIRIQGVGHDALIMHMLAKTTETIGKYSREPIGHCTKTRPRGLTGLGGYLASTSCVLCSEVLLFQKMVPLRRNKLVAIAALGGHQFPAYGNSDHK